MSCCNIVIQVEQPSKSYKLPLLQPPHILPIYLLDKSGIKQWFSFFTDQNFIVSLTMIVLLVIDHWTFILFLEKFIISK